MTWVWFCGRLIPEAEACIPATSRSIRLGVGLYETLRVARGHAPLLPRHLARLEAGARACGLWPGAIDWARSLTELAQQNRLEDGIARITLGDGFQLMSLAPLPPELEDQRRRGIALPTRPLERPFAALKGISRLDLELAERDAGSEVLLLRTNAEVLETTRANFFAITDIGLQTTPPPAVLPGIARALVLEIASVQGLAVCETPPRLGEATHWREAFATNAPRGLRPVIAIGGVPIGAGRPGPVSLQLQRALDLRCGLDA